jgi:hypothetical protein
MHVWSILLMDACEASFLSIGCTSFTFAHPSMSTRSPSLRFVLGMAAACTVLPGCHRDFFLTPEVALHDL